MAAASLSQAMGLLVPAHPPFGWCATGPCCAILRHPRNRAHVWPPHESGSPRPQRALTLARRCNWATRYPTPVSVCSRCNPGSQLSTERVLTLSGGNRLGQTDSWLSIRNGERQQWAALMAFILGFNPPRHPSRVIVYRNASAALGSSRPAAIRSSMRWCCRICVLRPGPPSSSRFAINLGASCRPVANALRAASILPRPA